MFNSRVCRYADFLQGWHKTKESELKIREIYQGHSAKEVDFVGRKFSEWCAISQALDERSMLRPGMRGLGFAVGTDCWLLSLPRGDADHVNGLITGEPYLGSRTSRRIF